MKRILLTLSAAVLLFSCAEEGPKETEVIAENDTIPIEESKEELFGDSLTYNESCNYMLESWTQIVSDQAENGDTLNGYYGVIGQGYQAEISNMPSTITNDSTGLITLNFQTCLQATLVKANFSNMYVFALPIANNIPESWNMTVVRDMETGIVNVNLENTPLTDSTSFDLMTFYVISSVSPKLGSIQLSYNNPYFNLGNGGLSSTEKEKSKKSFISSKGNWVIPPNDK